jgi:hypothetical protein
MVDSVWNGHGFHFANGVLAAVALVQAVVSGVRWRTGGPNAFAHVFGFATLVIVLHFADHLASFSTDLPVSLLLMVAAGMVYTVLSGGGSRRTRLERAYMLFAIALVLMTAVSIKLTAGVFAAGALILVLPVQWRRGELSIRAIVMIALVLCVFAGAWIGRGVLLSGYPFFPVSAGGVSVGWHAPEEHADGEVAYAAFTEREFSWRVVGSDWLELILLRDVYAVLVPVVVSGLALLMMWRLRSRAGRQPRFSVTWYLLIPICASIVFWFFSAPSHRYIPPLFWILAALSVAECQRTCGPVLSTGARRAWGIAVALIVLSPVIVEPALSAIWRRQDVWSAIVGHNVLTATPGTMLAAVNGDVPVKPFVTTSGLVLNVPARPAVRPGVLPNACWDAPLPCTPNPAPNLRLRVPGQLRSGFRVDGSWEMVDWPYYWQAHFLDEWRRRR